MIAVVICAVKMSTARVASYVVLMDANWTVLTLVSNEISLLLNAIHVRANRHNIVGQQLPTLLDVICCVRLHTLLLLCVVGSCCGKLETGQTFINVQTDATTPKIVGQ